MRKRLLSLCMCLVTMMTLFGGMTLTASACEEGGYYSDYIIPFSSDRLITEADVNRLGLTVQEINYAKNEIYARHGRKFKSAELTAYFNRQSWYYGYIEPECFTDNYLTTIEQKNVYFLTELEAKRGNYDLDANNGWSGGTSCTGWNSGYIIPFSSDRLITEADVIRLGLTVQEINYAKNEIYARHGRKFKSPELTRYFNSQSWYYGYIEAECFTDNYLTTIEQMNVYFLTELEAKYGNYDLH